MTVSSASGKEIHPRLPWVEIARLLATLVAENDFFLIFSFMALYFHMGNNTHSERKAASIHTPALDIPGFCRNSCCHIAGAPGWFSHCNSVFSIHQCRMSRTPPLPCPMIRKIISGSFGESGLKPPQGPEGPQKGKTRTSRLPQNRKSAGQSP